MSAVLVWGLIAGMGLYGAVVIGAVRWYERRTATAPDAVAPEVTAGREVVEAGAH